MTTLGIGLFISTVSRTQQQAMMSTFFFYFPAVLLSGFMFPIANMPPVAQWLTCANPLRYFLVILRGIFLKGVGAGHAVAPDGGASGDGSSHPLFHDATFPQDHGIEWNPQERWR